MNGDVANPWDFVVKRCEARAQNRIAPPHWPLSSGAVLLVLIRFSQPSGGPLQINDTGNINQLLALVGWREPKNISIANFRLFQVQRRRLVIGDVPGSFVLQYGSGCSIENSTSKSANRTLAFDQLHDMKPDFCPGRGATLPLHGGDLGNRNPVGGRFESHRDVGRLKCRSVLSESLPRQGVWIPRASSAARGSGR